MRGEWAAQRPRLFLWTPVAAGLGAAGYFAMGVEPSIWLAAPVALAAVVAVVVAARRDAPAAPALLLLAFVAAGFTTATLRTRLVEAPVVASGTRPVAVEGWVTEIASPGAGGPRVELAPSRIDGLAPGRLPVRVRLTLRAGETPSPGEAVRVRAILNPPPGPASPGSYDFARDAFFGGVGGVGLALTPPQRAAPPQPPWPLRLQMQVNAARWSLSRRIMAEVGGSAGGVAVAMTTGHEAFIAPEDTQAMRDSGLAHVLSISGLHMAIVGGFVFFAVRLAIAAVPALALRVPGKKVAAVAGLLAVGGYLVLSGAPAPAIRAAVTATVAFIAILLDRRALTLRALAVAALIVLALQPEAVVQPGFQMSFAATAALVALAEAWPARTREINAPWPILALQRSVAWVGAALGASLVAGLATTPFAVQHFNRVAMYALPANLATAPITSFLIMPALAVGAALAPLGLGGPFLWLAGRGVDLMLAVGRFAAAQPHAVFLRASGPGWLLAAAFLGILMLCLWRGRLRWLGLPLAAIGLWWPTPSPPDLWIASDGANLAVRSAGTAVLARPNSKRFGAEFWSRRRGLVLSERSPFLCNRSRCLPGLDGPDVALWSGRRAPTPPQMTELCALARVIVSRSPMPDAPPACASALVLDAGDFAEGGAAELWRTDAGWRVAWANDARSARPWGQPR